MSEDSLTHRGHVAVDDPFVHTNTHSPSNLCCQFKSIALKCFFYFQPQFIDFVSLVVPLLEYLVHT